MERMALDRYVIDTLMADLVGHDRHPSAYLLYLHLWSTTNAGEHVAETSLREMAEATGLSRRAVQEALARLARRKLVTAERDSITAVARLTLHRPWAKAVRPARRAR